MSTTTVKGKLLQTPKGFMVNLPTKKGTADFHIPESAKQFRDIDATDGAEVDVERDKQNRIVKVTVPGADEVAPTITELKGKKKYPSSNRQKGKQSSDNRAIKNLPKASPEIIGEPFHNPYTFIEFEENLARRMKPTLLTADECSDGEQRITGVLQLRIETISPLMTCRPIAEDDDADHKTYRALTIDNDVIVPATGVRGALRTLMTILTSGSLGYLDETAYLIQGRDVQLGPRGKNGGPHVPEFPFLGMVEVSGTANRSGRIRLGETRLIRLSDLKNVDGINLSRPPFDQPIWLKLDVNDIPVKTSNTPSLDTPWRLRLSGQPVGGFRIEKNKKEGVFKPGDAVIEIPAQLWGEFAGRNVFGDRSHLRPGDVVWLEPSSPDTRQIRSKDDVKSLQWARWGKRGIALSEKVPGFVRPDAWRDDETVDEVTNLFGQVAQQGNQKAVTFASRILPENLVFAGTKEKCKRTTLAPLAPPHPGCLAFYRDNDNPDLVDFGDGLRGYKVYRTTKEQGDDGPWNYSVQGVYDKGKLKPPNQKVNKTVDLLPDGQTGSLRIAFRALTQRELALLVQACSLPWRLGGGKPLGLGACTVSVTKLIDEFGRAQRLSDLMGENWQDLVSDIQHRVNMWLVSQKPVDRLRYPRAVRGNARGGHAWFQQHARPRMVSVGDDGKREGGLMPIYIDGELKEAAKNAGHDLDSAMPMMAGQILPPFNPEKPESDLLYGYDMIGTFSQSSRNKFSKFERTKEFDSSALTHGNESLDKAYRNRQKQRWRDS